MEETTNKPWYDQKNTLFSCMGGEEFTNFDVAVAAISIAIGIPVIIAVQAILEAIPW